MLIIKASKDSITDYEIPFGSVRYIANSRELLDSHIILGTDQKIYDIDYNSVSNEISAHVMKLLRERIFTESKGVSEAAFMDRADVPDEDYLTLTNMIRDEEEQLSILGYQKKVRVMRHYTSILEKHSDSHHKYDLKEALFFTNGKELIVVDSVHEVKTIDEPDYSYRYTFIRLQDITHIEFVDEPLLEGVRNLVIRIGESSVAFKVSDDFDCTYMKRYLGVSC